MSETWALLAPGPSASVGLAERLRGLNVGVIGNAFQLAPWAQFIAASDSAWWRKFPEAMDIPLRYSMGNQVPDVELVAIPPGTYNSGVLGLEVAAKKMGAKRILLFGFDMHGSHFFGPYKNGLRNTNEAQRLTHLKQYENWARINPSIDVVNCTEGSAIKCFRMASIDEVLHPLSQCAQSAA